MVFARGHDGAIYHRWQIARNGDWSGWEPLGGVLTSDPAAALNADGGLVVFARGTDNGIWHRWQPRPDSDWSGWEPLGGNWASGPGAVQYPRDTQFTIRRIGQTLLFFSYSPQANPDPALPQMAAVLETLGTPLTP